MIQQSWFRKLKELWRRFRLDHAPGKSRVWRDRQPAMPCVDCGVSTRDLDEYYMVTGDVWLQAGMHHPFESGDGELCISCLEDRVGRRLRRKDFICAISPISDRLRARSRGSFWPRIR